jgi:hypothetical protein
MRGVRLLSELVGALAAGATVILVAREAGAGPRAFGAVVAVPIAVGALIALPALEEGKTALFDRRGENVSLTAGEAQIKTGHDAGISVEFFAWVHEHLSADDTFHLEIGRVPEEVEVAGVGVRQASILQWGLYQLAPNLAVEQSAKARDLRPGEGRRADWIVFYESDPATYPVPLGREITYAPGFAIARSGRAD